MELADTGYAPCWFVDDVGPFFRKADTRKWLAANLYSASTGRSFPRVIQVAAPVPATASVPLPLLALADRLIQWAAPASLTGVYFLVKDGTIVYVGQSTSSIAARVGTHAADHRKEFDTVFVLPLPAEDAFAVEQALIRMLRPPLNHDAEYSMTPDQLRIAKEVLGAVPRPQRDSKTLSHHHNHAGLHTFRGLG
jgi:hypothetical protein